MQADESIFVYSKFDFPINVIILSEKELKDRMDNSK